MRYALTIRTGNEPEANVPHASAFAGALLVGKTPDAAFIHDFNGVPVKYLCLDDLLSSKLAVSRAKDADDILFLQCKKDAIGHKE